MSNKQKDGIRFQKKSAKKLGGKYLGKKYIGDKIGDIDIGGIFHVETKLLDKIPKYMEDVMKQSLIDSLRGGFRIDGDSISTELTKYPIALIQGRNTPWRDGIVLIRAGDFVELTKDVR